MKNNKFLFALLVILGLAIKIPAIFYMGMHDMKDYSNWGMDTYLKGLKAAYIGSYFPFQYQLFAVSAWMNTQFNLLPDFFIGIKAVNLFFDIGIFVILYKFLKKNSLEVKYALLYWLFPWFLNVFWLGYIDFQFCFFILLFIYCYKVNSPKILDYIVAGLSMALAFMMKPQVQFLYLLLFIYSLVELYKKRTIIQFWVFIPSVLLFGCYGLVLGFKFLIFTYLNVSNIMPVLTAHMLNIWYPLAYLLKEPGAPIWSVTDTFLSIRGIPVLRMGVIAFILALSFALIYKLKNSKQQILYLFTFGSTIVPFVMTSAHENHLFLSSILLCVCMALFKDKVFSLCCLSLIMIQELNIFLHYQLGANPFSEIDTSFYTRWRLDFVLSIVSCVLFFVILKFFARKVSDLNFQKAS